MICKPIIFAVLIGLVAPEAGLAQQLRTYNGSPHLNMYPYKTPLWTGGANSSSGSSGGGGGWGGLTFPSGNWRQEEQLRQMRLRQQQYMQQPRKY